METTAKPAIKQGWLRASIYLIGFLTIAALGELIGSFVAGSIAAGTEEGDNYVFGLTVLHTISNTLLLILTWLFRKFIDRRSFKSLGFEWKGYDNEAGIGFFAALAILGLGTLLLVTLTYISFVNTTFNVVALIIEAFLMIQVAFIEELVVRGYILNNLMHSMNKWVALVTSSAIFAIFHLANPDLTWLGVVNVFVAGILLGLNYVFTRNLWFGIFFHFAWNYFQGPILGFDVSGLKLSTLFEQSVSGPELWTGGPFGFEGSLLCALLIISSILILGYAFRRRYNETT